MIRRFRINRVYIHPHSGIRGGKPIDDLLVAGLEEHARVWRQRYGINYRYIVSKTSGIPVEAMPIIIKGQHYRGLAKNKSRIYLHNGYVPAENRWSNTMWARDEKAFIKQVGIILHHEDGHCMGLRFPSPDSAHSKKRDDLMHAWCGYQLLDTLPQFKTRFGMLKQRIQSIHLEETIETAPFKNTEANCYRGHCFAVTP